MKLWPHQTSGLDDIKDAMDRGVRRILLTSPTGGGKTVIMFELLKWRFRTVFYLHRKMLLEQFAERLDEAGVNYGVRASGHKPALLRDVQLSSIATENERVFKQGKWKLHDAMLVFIDEAHDQKADVANKVIDAHIEQGATVVSFTATPMGLGGIYDELIVAGNNTELRHCGALLPSTTYAPDEPAAPKLKPTVDGKYTEAAIKGACGKTILTGNIFHHWKKLNPEALPTIGFACSIASSLGHAEEFYKRGVPAAHIDGDDTWINGEWHFTDTAARQQLREGMESGEIKVVWNRFVLREGIDWTFIYHGIFATIFGSLTACLQAGGRVLRNHPTLDHVIFQDHGGNWWRHGSLNSDRQWNLHDTHRIVTGTRDRRLREKKEPEPIRCRQCSAVRDGGRACPSCGEVSRVRSRMITQSDGKLRETLGDIFKPRRTTNKPHMVQIWERVYYRAKKTGMTFGQAAALFSKENDWFWPSPEFPLMPLHDEDWFRRVSDVATTRLTGRKQEHAS